VLFHFIFYFRTFSWFRAHPGTFLEEVSEFHLSRAKTEDPTALPALVSAWFPSGLGRRSDAPIIAVVLDKGPPRRISCASPHRPRTRRRQVWGRKDVLRDDDGVSCHRVRGGDSRRLPRGAQRRRAPRFWCCDWVRKVVLRATDDPVRLPRIRRASGASSRRRPHRTTPVVSFARRTTRVRHARVCASCRVRSPILSNPVAHQRRHVPLTILVFSILPVSTDDDKQYQLRAEQSSGKQVGSEDTVQETASPKGEGEVLDLPSESSAKESSEPSLGEQISALKNKGASDPDASDNIFVGALEEVGKVEWPTVGTALSTTGIVIAIVIGSTFVLLSVNSVLSAVSQKLFG